MNLLRRYALCVLRSFFLCAVLALLARLSVAGEPIAAPSPESFTAISADKTLPLPPLVVRYAPAKFYDVSLDELSRLSISQASTHAGFPLLLAVDYLQEALQRMTGRTIPVAQTQDPSKGVVLTLLSEAPTDLKNNPDVVQALRNTGEDAYNSNEAYYIRSEKDRVVVIGNTPSGVCNGVVELLESCGYEVLAMGPDWINIPDYTKRPLTFSIHRSGRPGFYLRNMAAASGQTAGVGTLLPNAIHDRSDEGVPISYQRWLTGFRMATQSMPAFPGHSLQGYHRDAVKSIWQSKITDGFLCAGTELGPDANRPAASPDNQGYLWINDDAGGAAAGKVYWSNGVAWGEQNLGGLPASLDLSVPAVRQILLHDLKQKSEQSFAANPDGVFLFATEPEDGGGYSNIGKQLKNPNWYPEYLASEKVKFPGPYTLNGFKGLEQPQESWDPEYASDTVFAFNNWLLREYDKWIDSRPVAERITATGRSKKELVRCSLYSYNFHDVPSSFNLDPRIRLMVAGYPKHRGIGKWKNFASDEDIASAFRLLTPREPSGAYWILSLSYYADHSTQAIMGSPSVSAIQQRVSQTYNAGFKALSAEVDFNSGRMGLAYYLYSKMLWNPRLSAAQLEEVRDHWLQLAFGGGWREMKKYYDFMSRENAINAPNNWAKAIRIIDEAASKIDEKTEPEARRRLDDVKQFWYFYYLLESGQPKPPSPAFREFVWKGQMSYMTAMHMVTTRFFNTSSAAEAAGPEFNAGPAHYTASETQAWWSKVLDFWKVTPVQDFTQATLADGTSAKDVDVNDLVAVQEFQGTPENPLPFDVPFLYSTEGKPASFLTVVSKAGEEIGFKMYWRSAEGDANYRPRAVPYGISRWNTVTKTWDEYVDEGTTCQQSEPQTQPNGSVFQVVEARYAAPRPGAYRVDVGKGGYIAVLSSLNYDIATDKYTQGRGQTFFTPLRGLTQSGVYLYIPKGTKSLDMEIWTTENRRLYLYNGLPSTGLKPTRTLDVQGIGTHTVALEPGEDGSLAVIHGDNFAFPYLYSIPLLWAKSPEALLIPRAIAKADGLSILK